MKRAALVSQKITGLVAMLSQQSLTVTQRGINAYVLYDEKTGKPKTVNVPYIPEDASDDFLNAIEGFLDHEVGHLLFSDFDVLIKAKSLGIQNLQNLVEDTYIERKMAQRFSGSGYNLTEVGGFFLKNYTEKALAENPGNAFGILLVPAMRALAGQAVFADFMNVGDRWQVVEKFTKTAGDYAREALPKIESSAQGLEVALKIRELMNKEEEKQPESADDSSPGEEGDESGDSEKSSKKKKKGSKGKSDKKEKTDKAEDDSGKTEGDETDSGDEPDDTKPDSDGKPSKSSAPGDSKDDEPGSGNEETEGGKSPTSDGSEDPGSGESESPREESADEEGKAESKIDMAALEEAIGDYDEKLAKAISAKATTEAADQKYWVWSRDFDLIEDYKKSASDRDVRDMLDEVDGMIGPLQKDLERAVAARSLANWSSGFRSGRLHSAALTRLTMFNDPEVFRRKQVNHTRDVAIELVVDCSGSMHDGKIKTAAYTAYGLSSVLDRLNISHEIIGFTTKGRLPAQAFTDASNIGLRLSREERLYMPIFKGFDQRMNPKVRSGIASLSRDIGMLRENVDGECVMIAAQRLALRREARKIMIVLSDGEPCCPGDERAQSRNLKNSIKYIESQKMDVLGIGIESNAVLRYYDKHVVLKSVADLPTTVMHQIKTLLMR